MSVVQKHQPSGLNHLPNLYSEIQPRLWQGGTAREQVIDREQLLTKFHEVEREFDAVATLYPWAAPMQWGIEERRLGFPDGELKPEYLAQIESIADWAHAHWASGRRVLVRCAGGMNRSGLITAMVLMRAGHSADAAISLVRKGRSEDALSNSSFVRYLRSTDGG